MTTRHDVSMVRPQGAYLAKRCPVRIQNDVLQPVEPLPPGEDAQLRMQDGIDFEAEIFAQLEAIAGDGWVFVAEGRNEERAIAATLSAMESGAELIAGGWLPIDTEGKRSGKPDLLVRVGDGYVPVDVKHHLTLDADEDGSAETSLLETPSLDAIKPRAGWCRRKSKDDALQLAHYRRMLEAIGQEAESKYAGIIGKERVVVWYDLDEPLWQTPAKSDGRKRRMRSSLEAYDFEFAFRLDIAAVAHQSLEEPSIELLVEPVRCADCPNCPWREYCSVALCAGSGDPSLLPWVGFREWRALRDEGIRDREGVASLDFETACLAAEGVALARWIDAAAASSGDTVVAKLIPRANRQIDVLRARGIDTAGEVLARVDPAIAAFDSVSFLPKAILNARAALGEAAAYRRPGVTPSIPRADIEIDIDMENVDDGVYLWGVLTTDRGHTGLVESGYAPFATWDTLDEVRELAIFRDFWEWLTLVLEKARSANATVRAYCWHASAENTQMRRIAAADAELAAEVNELIASEIWVDLEKVFDNSFITGGSTGLKAIAPLAGHQWPVDDPGGGMSMVRHVEATEEESEAGRRGARDWILEYNRGDVEATRRIREWLDTEGAAWPELPLGEWSL